MLRRQPTLLLAAFLRLLRRALADDELLLTRRVNTSVLRDDEFEAELRAAAPRGEHAANGTHIAVVIPTCTTKCPADLARLQAALARWSEQQHVPCRAAAPGVGPAARLPDTSSCEMAPVTDGTYSAHSPPAFNAHLLIYMDVAATLVERQIRQTLSSGRALPCFRGLSFASARLAPSDNTYPRAPNLMFYKLVLHMVRVGAFHYFLVLEADVTPLRPDWLPNLAAHLPPRAARFWVKGSTGRGMTACAECRHINGNALYHGRDGEFGGLIERLHTSQAKFEEKKHSRRIGFDAALHYTLLLRSGALSARLRRESSHLYAYSDFIVDHYAPISLDDALRAYPCALLLHPNRSSAAADLEHRPGGAKHNLFAKAPPRHGGPQGGA